MRQIISLVVLVLLCMLVAPVAADTGSGSGAAIVTAPTAPLAPAAAAAALPDPVADPVEAVSFAYQLYRTGTIPAAVIVTAFLLLGWLAHSVAWLQEGKRAAIIAAALGGLAILVDVAANGLTPNASMFGTALATGIALFLAPKPAPKAVA
jgi:hypothetical protein